MEKKSYKFSIGINASQEELTIEQDYKIMELLSELGIEDGKEILNTSIKDIIGKLVKNDLLSKLLNVILSVKENKSEPNWKKLKNSELNEVIKDFFSLNPLVLMLFKSLGSVQGIRNLNTTSLNSEQNAESLKQDS
jgi:hypothetical protein